MMIQHEITDTRTPREMDPKVISMLAAFTWIRETLNELITGPCGGGKSFVASPLVHAACRSDYSLHSYRLPRYLEELARQAARASQLIGAL